MCYNVSISIWCEQATSVDHFKTLFHTALYYTFMPISSLMKSEKRFQSLRPSLFKASNAFRFLSLSSLSKASKAAKSVFVILLMQMLTDVGSFSALRRVTVDLQSYCDQAFQETGSDIDDDNRVWSLTEAWFPKLTESTVIDLVLCAENPDELLP